MANELDNLDLNAEEAVELDEFKADGENSSIADPISTGSNKRGADKTAKFTPPAPGSAKEKNGTDVSGKNGLTVEKGKAPARKGDKPGGDSPVDLKYLHLDKVELKKTSMQYSVKNYQKTYERKQRLFLKQL